jgi:SAM-dependent methyltransferase
MTGPQGDGRLPRRKKEERPRPGVLLDSQTHGMRMEGTPQPKRNIKPVDLPAATLERRGIIARKTILQAVYLDWYDRLARTVPSAPGRMIELGSGPGFLAERMPDVLTSDILRLPDLDLVVRGEALPFSSGSLKAILMIDVFHHVPQIRRLLAEAARCLRPGGVMAMIEPWRSPWSDFVYRYFHREAFRPEAKEWEFVSTGPLSGANGALPWIVFERDRRRFEKEFPQLRIAGVEPHTPILYLLSGGFSLPALVPDATLDFWRRIEARLQPRMRTWAMFATIRLVRTG